MQKNKTSRENIVQLRKGNGTMIIKNVQIFRENKTFTRGDLIIHEGKFADIAKETEEITDGHGWYAIPGLIDIHFHGCAGYDFCDGTQEALEKISAYEASVGVTGICPASMTIEESRLYQAMKNAGEYTYHGGAKLQGIHMEGPFISEKKKGAQAAENIRTCDLKLYRRLQEASGGQIRIVDIAPETEAAMPFIAAVKDEVVIALAHTTADYDTATEAFASGASHVTHLFNAMPPFHHRDPGVIGAAADTKECRVELICDGIHVHPSMVRAAFSLFGPDRIILISDSMRAAGLADGQYTLGGQDVHVQGKLATLNDGTIAGSVTNLMDCVQTAVKKMGIPLADAVACATINPAKEIGIYDHCGSITPGKDADLVLLDENLRVRAVYIDGIFVCPSITTHDSYNESKYSEYDPPDSATRK